MMIRACATNDGRVLLEVGDVLHLLPIGEAQGLLRALGESIVTAQALRPDGSEPIINEVSIADRISQRPDIT